MAGQKDLYAQIVAKLRTDNGVGGLVSLVSDSSTSQRIHAFIDERKASSPRLTVKVIESVPLNDNITLIQSATVQFCAISSDRVKSIEILDRLETLMDFIDNRSYYDFSGGNIVTSSVMFKLRNNPILDTENDVWTGDIEVKIIWSKITCPS